jgi:hypothetical protein
MSEGKLVLTAEDRTAAAFASLERRIKNVSAVASRARSFLPSGLASTLTVAGLGAFVQRSAEAVSQQRALADSLGLTIEKFSGYNYIARQSEVTQEALGKALFKVNNLLKEGATEGTKAAKLLLEYGITSEQIRNGSAGTDEALRRIADRFAAMPNGIEKSAAAAQLLGDKLGQQLVPFLNQGSAGFERLASEGKAAGAVLSTEVADAAAKANDRLATLAMTVQTKTLTFLYELGEAIGTVAAQMVTGTKSTEPFEQEIDRLTTTIAGLQGQLRMLEANSGKAETGGILGALLHTGDAAKIAETRNQIAELTAQLERAKQAQMDLLSAPRSPGRAISRPKVTADQSAALKETIKFEEYLNGLYERNIEAISGKTAATLKYEAALSDLNELLARGKISEEEHGAAVERTTKAYEDAKSGMTVFAEQAGRNIQNLTADLLKGQMAGKNFGRAITEALRDIAAELAAQAALTALFNAIGGSFGAPQLGSTMFKRAAGGPVAKGGLYEVNERGPEVLSTGGKDFLMMGGMSGYVSPTRTASADRSISVTINNSIDAKGATAEMLPHLLRVVRESEARTKAQIYESLRRKTAPV